MTKANKVLKDKYKNKKAKPSPCFAAVGRSQSTFEKTMTKQPAYNTDILYVPKYDFVHKKAVSPVRLKQRHEITANDSRDDIFWNRDWVYTTQVKLEKIHNDQL